MKADLVFAVRGRRPAQQGYYTDGQLRSVYAGGILRVLQNVSHGGISLNQTNAVDAMEFLSRE